MRPPKGHLPAGAGKRTVGETSVRLYLCECGRRGVHAGRRLPGHNVIAENGHILKESERFGSGVICTEIDVKRIEAERRRMTTFEMAEDGYVEVRFSLETEETALTRFIDPMPFVPEMKPTVSDAVMRSLAIQRRD